MTIDNKRENDKLVMSISGRIDTVTSGEFDKCIEENTDGISELIIDLKELTYTSSAGLRVFLKAKKKMSAQGSMKVINVPESVMEIFDMTGFSDILTIE